MTEHTPARIHNDDVIACACGWRAEDRPDGWPGTEQYYEHLVPLGDALPLHVGARVQLADWRRRLDQPDGWGVNPRDWHGEVTRVRGEILDVLWSGADQPLPYPRTHLAWATPPGMGDRIRAYLESQGILRARDGDHA